MKVGARRRRRAIEIWNDFLLPEGMGKAINSAVAQGHISS